MSMLRSLDHRDRIDDVVVVHSAHTEDEVIFGSTLRDLDERHPGMRLELWLSGDRGRITPDDLGDLCPDWRERDAFCSGPRDLLDASKNTGTNTVIPKDSTSNVSSRSSVGMPGAARAAPSTSSTARKRWSATGEHPSWSQARTPA